MRSFRFLGLEYLAGGSRSSVGPRLLAVADQLGRVVLERATPPDGPPDLRKGWITVAKIDHLGDLMMATPFLAELRRQRPDLRIQLLCGSWSLPLARVLEQLGLCHEIVALDAAALNRSGGPVSRLLRQFRTDREAVRRVRRRAPSCFVDLRPFSPNSLGLALRARVPFRVGFGMRGLSYTLHRTIPVSMTGSLGQMFLDALPLIGLQRAEYLGPSLPRASSEARTVGATHAVLGSGPYLVVHPASPHADRQVPLHVWRPMLDVLSAHLPIVAVGTAADAVRFGALSGLVREGRWHDLMGRTTFPELLEVVRASAGGLVIDSLVAHLLLSDRKPSVVLMTPDASCRNSFPDHAPSIDFVSIDDGSECWTAAATRLAARLDESFPANASPVHCHLDD